MPTYEYLCRACGERLEVVQAFSDDALTKCPKCGNELRKVFGNVGIVLKGNGFYKTDNRVSSKSSKSSTTNGKDKSAEFSGESAASKDQAPAGETASRNASGDHKSADAEGSSTKSEPKSAPSAAVGAPS